MKDNIIYIHTDKRQMELVQQARKIVRKCRLYHHRTIPEFIINRAGLKEVV